jgi:hypothetical protein
VCFPLSRAASRRPLTFPTTHTPRGYAMEDDESTSQPFAPIVEQMGMTAELGPNDQVTAMIIITKTMNFESGDVFLGYYRSEGLDWIDARGMLGAAGDIASSIGSLSAFGGCGDHDFEDEDDE